MATKKTAGVMSLEQAIAEYTALRDAAQAKRASSDNPDNSSHPTATAPDNTEPAKEGERSAENEKDVEENISSSVNTWSEAAPREDASDCIDYHGAPVLENEQGVPPVGTTQNDPGTTSRLDVSTEKTAADEVKRIAQLVRTKGRAKAAAELAAQALADLDAQLNPGLAAKRAAAQAGAEAAQADLNGYDEKVMALVKRAMAEAVERGRELGQEYAEFYFMAKKAARQEMLYAKLANGELSEEEVAAALAAEENAENENVPEGEGGAGAVGEDVPAEGEGGETELPPEDIGALMALAQNEGGDLGGGGEEPVVPDDGAMALSDALDNLGLTPEQLMELEAAVQEAQEASPEAAAEELGKVASTLNAVSILRNAERVGRLRKFASAKRTTLTAQVQQDIINKTAFVQQRFLARVNAAKAAQAARA